MKLYNFAVTSTTGQYYNVQYKEKPRTFSEDQVRSIVQNIWSEFAELPRNFQTMTSLKNIIKVEVENNPRHPIEIFKK